MDVTGKVALVTGGGRGIGRGIALALAENGGDVAVADINDRDAERVAAEAQEMGRSSTACHVDVTDQGSVEQMARAVVERFGRIDILVNNAGVVAAAGWESRETVTQEDWDVIFAVNVEGVARVTEVVSRHMEERLVRQNREHRLRGGETGHVDEPTLRRVESGSYQPDAGYSPESGPF